jgi:Ni/Co efflux regulator RcnB
MTKFIFAAAIVCAMAGPALADDLYERQKLDWALQEQAREQQLQTNRMWQMQVDMERKRNQQRQDMEAPQREQQQQLNNLRIMQESQPRFYPGTSNWNKDPWVVSPYCRHGFAIVARPDGSCPLDQFPHFQE